MHAYHYYISGLCKVGLESYRICWRVVPVALPPSQAPGNSCELPLLVFFILACLPPPPASVLHAGFVRIEEKWDLTAARRSTTANSAAMADIFGGN